jgi:hypothetical protein
MKEGLLQDICYSRYLRGPFAAEEEADYEDEKMFFYISGCAVVIIFVIADICK